MLLIRHKQVIVKEYYNKYFGKLNTGFGKNEFIVQTKKFVRLGNTDIAADEPLTIPLASLKAIF